MAILPVKSPLTITIIERGAPLLLLAVAGHGGCFKICDIWNNRLLSDPFCNLIFVILGWIPTLPSSLWPAVYLDMAPFTTTVTSLIRLYILPSSISTTIYTMADLEVKFLHILVEQLINGHRVCLYKWRLFLKLLLSGSWLPPLWINGIAVFACRLFYMGLIGSEIL